jgi:hypothetical protein
MSAALRMACAAAFAPEALKKTLPPESLSWMICESTVGSVASWRPPEVSYGGGLCREFRVTERAVLPRLLHLPPPPMKMGR